MTNGEKYKTAAERSEAFHKFCHSFKACRGCPIQEPCEEQMTESQFYWLDIEAEEEKPMPCPFCGGECKCESIVGISKVECQSGSKCRYQSGGFISMEEAIAAHNRVARAVADAKKKEKDK